MKSKVYFINLRASMKETLFQKLDKLLERAGLSEVVGDRDLTAVKIHFGEMGISLFIPTFDLSK